MGTRFVPSKLVWPVVADKQTVAQQLSVIALGPDSRVSVNDVAGVKLAMVEIWSSLDDWTCVGTTVPTMET